MKRLKFYLVVSCVWVLYLALIPVNAQSKRVYIALDDHTDYVYSLTEEENQQAFLNSIDYYLNLADSTAGLPSARQSRWNCDGNFWIYTYEKRKSAAEFARLIARMKDGHISAPMTALVSTYGAQPAEAVLRGMYYAGSLERRYGLKFNLAVAMENATLPYGLGSLWAGAGAKYSWRGICGCATRTPGANDRPDIYWWQGLDKSRILMKWNQFYVYPGSSLGNYFECRFPDYALQTVLTDSAFQTNWPYNVIGIFGKGGDDAETLTDSFVTFAQNNSNSAHDIIVSNESDFFQDFENSYGSSVPVFSRSYGNEWDLLAASMAEVTASVKRSVEKLRTGEALQTLVSLKNPSFYQDKAAVKAQAWEDLGLYWEHDWTADGYVKDQRPGFQRKLANEIGGYVNQLSDDSGAALGGMIPNSSTNIRFYAFNPLSWTRTDFADFPLTTTGAVYAVDISTGLEAPSQMITVNGQTFLRVLASDIPPAGYKVFEVRNGAGATYSDAAAISGNVIENPFYRITVGSNGSLTSIIDKTRGNREFARQIGGKFINDLGPGSGTVEVENRGPVSVTLKITSSAPLMHVTRLTLFRNSDRIDIRNEVNQNFSDVYTWSFGFNLDNPSTNHEEVGAVIQAKTFDQGGPYATSGGRHDWLTFNHFADMTGSGSVGVTLSNADAAFMQLGNSDVLNLDTTTPSISALLGGQVDGPYLGIPNQNGDSFFLQRYALRTHDAYDGTAAMRFSLEHQNPLYTHQVTGGSGYPETSFSLLSISDPSVILWALKPAEEGISQGIIARTYNGASQATTANLSLSLPVSAAYKASHLETNISGAPLTSGSLGITSETQQFLTHRLITGSTATNLPPVTGIIGPLNGASFALGSSVMINAVAADADGSVARVEFFDGATKLGEAAAAPYSLTVDTLLTGTHVLTARVTDNNGGVSFSSQVRISVVAATSTSTSVSAASYRKVYLAPGAIAAAFGPALASGTAAAPGTPLPTTLSGTQVSLKDSLGRQYLCQIFYVSPNQVNYLIPDAASAGTAQVTITSTGKSPSTELLQISQAVPGLFSATADGSGLAAATITRITAAGVRTDGNTVVFDTNLKKYVAIPIDMGVSGDKVFLILYGTGLRGGVVNPSIQVGGVTIPVDYIGPQGSYIGLDQVNILLPRVLIGRGDVPISLGVQGQVANTVTVNVK